MFASISVDLDGIDCYHSIHGLDPPTARDSDAGDPRETDPIYEIALGRFLELVGDLEIDATLFVITRDLARESVGARLSEASSAGHEIASHTHDHPYNLTRLNPVQIAEQIDRATDAITDAIGKRPVGFRAPGYGVNRTVLDVLWARGYRYDSSVLPCPPYYLAKAAVMLGLWAARRPSGASLSGPQSLLAPLQPYRPDPAHFHRPAKASHTADQLWEIPLCVAPFIRVPVIGTTIAMFGSRHFRSVYPSIRRAHPFLNIEFHGIDFLDSTDPGISSELRDRQPDLRRPLAEKWRSFRDVLRLIKLSYEFGTLEQMVDRMDSR